MKFRDIESAIQWVIDQVKLSGIEGLFRRYYGTYTATVASNEDPDGLGRCQLTIPILGSTQAGTIWAWPVVSGGSSGGFVYTPDKGDTVWVQFEYGDPSRPIYIGGRPKKGGYYAEIDAPTKRGIVTAGGSYIVFDDANGDTVLQHKSGGVIRFLSSGDIEVIPSAGKNILLGEAATANLVRSDTFQALFNTHTHTCASPGSPTTPPVVPMTDAQSTVTTKAS